MAHERSKAAAAGYPCHGTKAERVEWVAQSIIDASCEIHDLTDDPAIGKLTGSIAADAIELGKIFGFELT